MGVGALALTLTLLLSACSGGEGTGPGYAAVGEVVPDYAAATLAGGTVSLAELRGRPVLLNVWATWCPPCRDEMPGLQALHERMAERGLRVVGVSVDSPGAAGEIEAFRREFGVTFPLLHDPEQRISDAFQTRGVPETFLIGKDGTVMRRWRGRIEATAPSVVEAVEAALET